MELNGQQRAQFQQALLSAFPRRSDLEQMLSHRLNWELNEISGENQNQSDTIFALINYARAKGTLQDLIEAAQTKNPRNEDLLCFVTSLAKSLPIKKDDLAEEVKLDTKLRLLGDERLQEFKSILRELDSCREKEEKDIVAIWGAQHTGKTILAKLICDELNKSKVFKGGIFWISLKDKTKESALHYLYELIFDSNIPEDNLSVVVNRLKENEITEPYLIVLDGVKQEADLALFYSARGKRCTFLMTTQYQGTYDSFLSSGRVEEISLRPFTHGTYVKLLMNSLKSIYPSLTEEKPTSSILAKVAGLASFVHKKPGLFPLVKDDLLNRKPSLGYSIETALETTLCLLEDLKSREELTKKSLVNLKKSRDSGLIQKIWFVLKVFPPHVDIPIDLIQRALISNLGYSYTITLCDWLAKRKLLARNGYKPLKTIRLSVEAYQELQELDMPTLELHRKIVDYYKSNHPSDHESLIRYIQEQENDKISSVQWSKEIQVSEREYLIRFYAWHLRKIKSGSNPNGS